MVSRARRGIEKSRPKGGFSFDGLKVDGCAIHQGPQHIHQKIHLRPQTNTCGQSCPFTLRLVQGSMSPHFEPLIGRLVVPKGDR